MRIAFYAPLKAPESPVPSGDRRIARLLIKALELGGHEVELLSRFRSFEGGGDRTRMERLGTLGQKLAARCIRRIEAMPTDRRPHAVFTYHVYDKAPDWIGPAVSQAFSIPYLICEASLNPARAKGAKATGYAAARAAVAAADAIVELNPADRPGVEAELKPGAGIWPLPPFIDTEEPAGPPAVDKQQGGEDTTRLRESLARAHGLNTAVPWLLTVAMMREGDKLESYRILAEALARLSDRPWQLLVAGDGAARTTVEDAFRTLGPERIRFLGQHQGDALSMLNRSCDIFVWPAVNEALGMAILEAQAAAMPVVAGDHGAIDEIVSDGITGLLVPERDAARFADALKSLLDDPGRTHALGRAAREKVQRDHGIAGAARLLDRALTAVVEDASNRKPRVTDRDIHRTRERETS
jgi:glycosyltransferase involved in cell wall biosynthesis